MVSGSQLQVAKLAQMCPAAASSNLRCPAATRVKTRVKTQVKTRVKTQTVPTSAFFRADHPPVPFLEHIILFTSFFKKKAEMSPETGSDQTGI